MKLLLEYAKDQSKRATYYKTTTKTSNSINPAEELDSRRIIYRRTMERLIFQTAGEKRRLFSVLHLELIKSLWMQSRGKLYEFRGSERVSSANSRFHIVTGVRMSR